MTSLYSEEINEYLHSRAWPKGLIIDVVEEPGLLRLKLYRENVNGLGGQGILKMSDTLNETIWHIRNLGVPCYLEVAAGSGRV